MLTTERHDSASLGRAKAGAQPEKHGLDFAIVTLDFLAAAIVRRAKQDRLQALGYIEGKAVSLDFRPLGAEAVTLISLRPVSTRERSLL